jgi:hypothetical protein
MLGLAGGTTLAAVWAFGRRDLAAG